ncbi:hypothetical protein C7H19_06375 [Aphanothece hegewaldii CCALA 016]|uniref:Peptidase C-terminal archaeal/bacterial domain-containing protein n=1 Tax=Aphanothece hegewaldii CCALA 016 TaxID=2107694 RepID=A0A2T1M088_9CHRO|nr:PPC domain-containing protein [Aphanothece hegewaldii]PSF38093.1 hypothetical protein C7H19_06375 [Aphanothece hegewaldii CCALA 016]
MAVNLFDVGYYREVNPDLALNGLTTDEQATAHFFSTGITENRLFSRFVDLNFYRASNSDLSSFDAPSLYNHLSNFGVAEGRRFSPFFDLSFYQRANLDLASNGVTTNEGLFNHYQISGINENRRTSALVDLGFYRSANADLAGLTQPQLLDHLRRFGINEERRFSPVIDLGIYEAANPDIKAANISYSGLLQHVGTNGVFEGRRLSLSYAPVFYVNPQNNLDLAGMGSQQLLDHFEFFGINEGRQASEYFNVNSYRINNPDLGINGIVTNQQALNHFEGIGFREERIPGNLPLAIPGGIDPGNDNNNLTTAANLGIFNSRRSGTITQQISSTDLTDIYRILIPTTSDVNISISGSNKPLNLEIIYDSNANNINEGGTSEQIFSRPSNIPDSSNRFGFNRTLGAGTYYVRVFASDTTTNTTYNLNFSATTVPMAPAFPDPGEMASTALNIGTLSSNPVFLQNFVGAVDPSDIYRFNIVTPSTLNLTLNNLNLVSNIDAPILNLYFDANNNNQIDDGESIESSRPSLNSPFINLTKSLAAGTYFLRLQQDSTFTAASNTRFSLNLSAS